MKVTMIKPTRWAGKSIAVGQETEVNDAVGQRWIRNGIAEQVDAEGDTGTTDGEGANEEAPSGSGKYGDMKPKELYDLCNERGIAAEARKSIAYYIKLLEADDSSVLQ